jgi:hypothetical protein
MRRPFEWSTGATIAGCWSPIGHVPPAEFEAAYYRTEGSRKDRRKGGCRPPSAGDPVNIPHDVENRWVDTRGNPEPDRQVS